ncbi:hypothetical protein [Siphonobacter sp. SORGH_AS_0500]|uniref:hypothetical protein n=1 Tax=Siphonobacter sp. SORGH_AS_0500 TaxID=1864824 RepID=UPI000CC77577|nr:hypothetical protein [Siphonobacter sp. SORGH_AS_0500]MDR6196254.1 hypothetical protein [Siphonobacter sp. SORGH_AS_0500]PKK38132.1 hypothetical protein BWI96_03380 [Siphonobacter sp. SORGH_AS_0500]
MKLFPSDFRLVTTAFLSRLNSISLWVSTIPQRLITSQSDYYFNEFSGQSIVSLAPISYRNEPIAHPYYK